MNLRTRNIVLLILLVVVVLSVACSSASQEVVAVDGDSIPEDSAAEQNQGSASSQPTSATPSFLGGQVFIYRDEAGRIIDVYTLASRISQVTNIDNLHIFNYRGRSVGFSGDVMMLTFSQYQEEEFLCYHEYHSLFEVESYERLHSPTARCREIVYASVSY